MAKLDQLPTEVLLVIIGLVQSNRDFLAFSRTSRSFHNITKNELPLRRKYRRIRIKENTDFDKAFNILISILRRPQLGDFVRHIEFDQAPRTYINYEINSIGLKELKDEDSERLRIAVQNAGFTGEYAENVINMALQPSFLLSEHSGTVHNQLRPAWVAQALTALLVSVSPYLETMTASQIMPNFTVYNYGGTTEDIIRFPLEKVLIETNAHPEGKPYLQNLRSVDILPHQGDFWEDERTYHEVDIFGMISLINQLPSMEQIGIDGAIEDENGLQDLVPSASNISRIRINHSNFETWFLSPLINSCKVLREFHYTIDGCGSPDGSYASFNPRTFLKAMLSHKATLEILHIDADSVCDFIDMGEYNDHWQVDRDEKEQAPSHIEPQGLWERTGSLRDFSALTQLNIGIGILLFLTLGTQGMETENPDCSPSFDEVVLADSLPDTLESLVIIGYEKGVRQDFDKIVEQFMADKDTKLPNLKHVSGVEEMIERAPKVDYPDEESEPWWEEEEWSEYEY
ncbi:hypothetical protein TMatcc_001524 [Talaromyces marneffei ATCC 18224]|uniref:F-box domain-containing protein n=1 Tax=Talaromyces marneffei (strain ATCC 18224 / CBS 334.59 / QM 7333) TaxID=441960 RepID=B6QH36_TALMQ|nr:uncharacterized protein EYB26_007248 [Talaromyces marneffei]EEA22681.1 conserved hypothetical protein [Talaromyces marneffei ATCC 18224]KAE8551570.1 hypothetical protein EYB25_005460 [Talaromyces marneffei]QGA19559.1 hypothetical protein EYB26_007248 [Talaromyces marneffei]